MKSFRLSIIRKNNRVDLLQQTVGWEIGFKAVRMLSRWHPAYRLPRRREVIRAPSGFLVP
jgi:hypothetical protein